MQILIVKSGIPAVMRSGTDIVSHNLLRLLALDHDVTFLGLAHSRPELEEAEAMRSICREVRAILAPNQISAMHRVAFKLWNTLKFIVLLRSFEVSYNTPPALHRALVRLLREREFDLVLIEYWHTASLRAAVADRSPSALMIHDAAFVNDARRLRVESSRLKRVALRPRFYFKKWEELRAISRFDRVVAISDADVRAIRRAAHGMAGVRFLTIPLSIVTGSHDVPDGGRDGGDERAKTLYFMGGLARVNHFDAVCFFLDEIGPRLKRLIGHFEFTVVGAAPKRCRRELEAKGPVRFVGFVPDSAQHVRSYRVCVAPLRIGSGVKIKILEAFVQGRPVVTTTIGAEGIDFFEESPSAVRDEPQGFAEEVGRLLTDPDYHRDVRERQRRWALEHLTIDANRERVRHVLELVAERAG